MVHLSTSSLASLGDTGAEVHLHTYLQMREDSLTLYGFATPKELELFVMLTSVSGVGPRIGLALLSALSLDQLVSALLQGNADLLARVPGVGRRLAGRLSVELKDKVTSLPVEINLLPGNDSVVVSALTNLGYSQSEATAAISTLPPDPSLSTEEKLRQALQHLARR
jgi:Holliday junction DNA helicase RuvA